MITDSGLNADTLQSMQRFAQQMRAQAAGDASNGAQVAAGDASNGAQVAAGDSVINGASGQPRLRIYQRLFFNNILSMLRQAYPVASKLVDESARLASISQDFRWIVESFYAQHRCETPRFTEFAPELLAFLQQHSLTIAWQDDWQHPWPIEALIELLHYEWLETELFLSAEELAQSTPNASDGETDSPLRLSPLARPVAYHFPVSHLSSTKLPAPQAPVQPTLLLVWRNRQHIVQFQALSLSALQLALQLQATPMRLNELPIEAHSLVQRWMMQDVVIG